MTCGQFFLTWWQGYMKIICKQEFVECTKVMALPFVMNPPSDLDTIYTCLCMAADISKENGKEFTMVTFDLPLYMKALQITLSLPPESKLKNVIIRLGGFHLIISFMGCICLLYTSRCV